MHKELSINHHPGFNFKCLYLLFKLDNVEYQLLKEHLKILEQIKILKKVIAEMYD